MTNADCSHAIFENAWAKVNLALHVIGQRDDGYHLLDSLVVFANTGDEVSVRAANELSMTITGPMASGLADNKSNLAMMAALRLKQAASARGLATSGAHIHLLKRLPIAAGIGGGSADAAATLRALNNLWNLSLTNTDLECIGTSLGADVPVCIAHKSTQITGIGTELDQISDFPNLHMVLANPNVAISTPKVFEKLENRENLPLAAFPVVNDNELWLSWIKSTRNDLQKAATSLSPDIERVITTLLNNGAKLARMSGSGATCFGIFANASEAQGAAKKLRALHPNWWVEAAQSN